MLDLILTIGSILGMVYAIWTNINISKEGWVD